jgi:tetratricopeptide (TPR) repeat protein
MSRIKEIKRQLDAAAEAVEALDAELAAGRLGVDEHGRQRAAREGKTGRLFVSLRRAQREAQGRRAEPPPAAPARARSAWLGSPAVMAAAALVLLVGGVAAGVAVSRWRGGFPGPGTPVGAPTGPPARDPSAIMSGIELQALRQVAAREDAPIPSLLQFAHLLLDQGQLGEARQVYERVLGREPRNAEAITHIGAVLFQEGRVEDALAKVEEALRLDARYIHAHWDRTQYLFYGKRDFPAAIKAAEAFLQVVPDGPDADIMRKLMAEARQQAGKAPSPAPTPR